MLCILHSQIQQVENSYVQQIPKILMFFQKIFLCETYYLRAIICKRQLPHDYRHNTANIFRVSHILPIYFASLQASETATIYEKRGNIDHIVQGKSAITYHLSPNSSFIWSNKKLIRIYFYFHVILFSIIDQLYIYK